jgi:hypothetical protein
LLLSCEKPPETSSAHLIDDFVFFADGGCPGGSFCSSFLMDVTALSGARTLVCFFSDDTCSFTSIFPFSVRQVPGLRQALQHDYDLFSLCSAIVLSPVGTFLFFDGVELIFVEDFNTSDASSPCRPMPSELAIIDNLISIFRV